MTSPALIMELKVVAVALAVLAVLMVYVVAEHLWRNRRSHGDD